MKNEANRSYYLANGKEFKADDDSQFERVTGPYIYEVIRVIDGVPLFEEAHIERMEKSIEALGYQMKKQKSEISSDMKRLVESNGVQNQNIKLIYGELESEDQLLISFFVESHYPDESVYKNGIKTILFESERENPNAKVMNVDLRNRVAEELKSQGAFEALLVDEGGNITEGSKSNFFFIKDGKLCTPPGEKVLLGITRSEIIKSASEKGIELAEATIAAKDVASLEGAFISGTSIDALPIRSIGNVELGTLECDIMKSIMQGYDEKVKNYIKGKKS